MAQGTNKGKVFLKGYDEFGNEVDAVFTSDGKLQVSTPPPTPPEDTTAVSQMAQSDMSGTSDTDYTIPNGETLVIQRFIGGGEGDGSTSKVELYYDPNGNGTGMTLIAVGYVSDNNFQFDLNVSYTGDGTRNIKMRRTRISSGTREVFGKWEGYY